MACSYEHRAPSPEERGIVCMCLMDQGVCDAVTVANRTKVDIAKVKNILEDQYESGYVRRILVRVGKKVRGVKYQWVTTNGNNNKNTNI